MIVSAKSLTASGAYLSRQAKQLARSLFTTKMRSKIAVIDAYMLRASRSGNIATCTIIDPPGIIVTIDSSGGGVFELQPRDYYSTVVGAPAVTYTEANTAPKPVKLAYFPIGFTVGNDPSPGAINNQMEVAAKVSRGIVHASARYVMGRLLVRTEPKIGVPNFDILPASIPGDEREAQLFASITVLNSQTVYGAGGGSSPYSGYALSSEAIQLLAPGYVLMREAEHGYAGWEYGAAPPAGAMVGALMIAAIPVTKQLGIGVTDWGQAAMLIVGLSPLQSDGKPAQSPIRWHYLWEPDQHPQSAVHPGSWVYEPDYKPAFKNTEWDAAWAVGDGEPEKSNIGSRPSWTDCLSCQPDAGGVLFRFRYATISGVPQIVTGGAGGPRGAFPTAEVEAVIGLYAAIDGVVTASYPSYEVFTSSANGAGSAIVKPFDEFVTGKLPVDRVTAIMPMATLSAGETIVSVDAEYPADRDAFFIGQTTHTWSGYMKNPHVSDFGLRIKSVDGNWLVRFSTLGAGCIPPMAKFVADRVLSNALSGYKAWDLSCLCATFSKDEIAILVFEDWQTAINEGSGTHTKVAIINVRTGDFRVTPRTGYYHTKTLESRAMPVLSVIQQQVVDKDDVVRQKAVLLVSGANSSAVLISRDSGETWQSLLTFPRPNDGSFYLGNALNLTAQPGNARVIR